MWAAGSTAFKSPQGLFQMWRGEGFTNEFQLFCTCHGGPGDGWPDDVCRLVPLPRTSPQAGVVSECAVDAQPPPGGSAGAGVSGLGRAPDSCGAAHQPAFRRGGVPLKDVPLPHEFILNPKLMAELYPSFAEGLRPFFHPQLVGPMQTFLPLREG